MLMDFHILNHILHLWDEAYLIMVNVHFDVFLDLACENFIEYFSINIHMGNWSEVLSLLSLSVVYV